MKYKIRDPEKAIYINYWWGFGPNSNTIVLSEKCTINNNNYVGSGSNDIKDSNELNNGKRNF